MVLIATLFSHAILATAALAAPSLSDRVARRHRPNSHLLNTAAAVSGNTSLVSLDSDVAGAILSAPVLNPLPVRLSLRCVMYILT